jgi:hypothetical protein
MGEIIAFRTSTPVITLDGAPSRGFFLAVRPCPPEVASVEHFRDARAAFDRATDLQREHGWRIDFACELGGFDGAA